MFHVGPRWSFVCVCVCVVSFFETICQRSPDPQILTRQPSRASLATLAFSSLPAALSHRCQGSVIRDCLRPSQPGANRLEFDFPSVSPECTLWSLLCDRVRHHSVVVRICRQCQTLSRKNTGCFADMVFHVKPCIGVVSQVRPFVQIIT